MPKRPDDWLLGKEDEDTGCKWLRDLLGRPIRCQDCVLPKCQYDLSQEEIREVEEKIRLIGGYKSGEELSQLLSLSRF